MAEDEKAPVNFVHNPGTPDVYADNASGFFIHNGVVRITLESARVNHVTSPGPVDRVVIGRIVMPLAAAEAMARGLLDFVSKQRTAGAPANITIQ